MFTTKLVDDDFMLIDDSSQSPLPPSSMTTGYLNSISTTIDKLSPVLRPVNLAIHDDPELGYHEVHAHELLTNFFSQQKGWKVTPHAYGIDTAFVAVFDSGRKGPVVSFNIEYGV